MPNVGSKNRSKRREKGIPGDTEKRVEKYVSGVGTKIQAPPRGGGKNVGFGGPTPPYWSHNEGYNKQQRGDTIQGYKGTRIQGYKDTRYKDTRIQGYKATRLQGYKIQDAKFASQPGGPQGGRRICVSSRDDGNAPGP